MNTHAHDTFIALVGDPNARLSLADRKRLRAEGWASCRSLSLPEQAVAAEAGLDAPRGGYAPEWFVQLMTGHPDIVAIRSALRLLDSPWRNRVVALVRRAHESEEYRNARLAECEA